MMKSKQITTWLTRALPHKTDYHVKDYMREPFVANGIVFVTDGVRAHIGAQELADVPVGPTNDKAERAANALSSMLLKARKGYRVTLPAPLLREVSDVIGKEKKDRANILRITLSSDTVEFERPGADIEISAKVSKEDGYSIESAQPLPEDGLTLAVNPRFLHDAVSIVSTSKRKQKQTEDTVSISIVNPNEPFAIDYQKLTALIMPMNAGA